MRDHLLGCQAFLPPEPEEHCNAQRAKPFALGIPQRAVKAFVTRGKEKRNAETLLTAFETGDHTPPEMQADFPREYDLMTMLSEAAGRVKFGFDFCAPGGADAFVVSVREGSEAWPDISELRPFKYVGPTVPEEYEALSRFYDAELQRLCDIK